MWFPLCILGDDFWLARTTAGVIGGCRTFCTMADLLRWLELKWVQVGGAVPRALHAVGILAGHLRLN